MHNAETHTNQQKPQLRETPELTLRRRVRPQRVQWMTKNWQGVNTGKEVNSDIYCKKEKYEKESWKNNVNDEIFNNRNISILYTMMNESWRDSFTCIQKIYREQ